MLGLGQSSGVLELTKELMRAIKTKKRLTANKRYGFGGGGPDRPPFSGSDNKT
jgi:hypothetical protein